MIYISENAIEKYNNNLIDNGIENVGTGYISKVSSKINIIINYILMENH